MGLDEDGNIVVIELKRTDEESFMDLQAIRYAALVSTMSFGDLVNAHEEYLAKRSISESPAELLFLHNAQRPRTTGDRTTIMFPRIYRGTEPTYLMTSISD